MTETWNAWGFEDQDSKLRLSRMPQSVLINTFVARGKKLISFQTNATIGNSKNAENKWLAATNEELKKIHPEAKVDRDARHLSTMNVRVPNKTEEEIVAILISLGGGSGVSNTNTEVLADQVAAEKKREESQRSRLGAEVRRGENRIEVLSGIDTTVGADEALAIMKRDMGIPLSPAENAAFNQKSTDNTNTSGNQKNVFGGTLLAFGIAFLASRLGK